MVLLTPLLGLPKAEDSDDRADFLTVDLAAGMTILDATVLLTAAQTLTNKTLTAPTINGTVGTTGLTLPAHTVSGTLTLSTAASKIVPGATSFSLRNNADGADNVLVSDAGAVTVRAGLGVGGTLTLTPAASKIVPGATSLSLRNTADSADNLILTDAGVATLRAPLRLGDGTAATPAAAFTSETNLGIFRPGANYLAVAAAGVNRFVVGAGGFFLKSDMQFAWAGGDPYTVAQDVSLWRDGAGVLAQRNGTSPQTSRLYGTFTDASNYERLAFSAAAGGPFAIASQALGTGTVRNLKLDPGTADLQWGKALVALGGGAAPTVGTIGGSGPATAAQNGWLRLLDSTGAACWVPVWK